MQRQGISSFLLVLVAVGVFGGILFFNSRPAPALRVIIPTESAPTDAVNSWETILQEGFGSDSTPLPTIGIPTAAFIAPTLALNGAANGQVTPLSPADVGSSDTVLEQFSVGVTATRPAATIAPLATVIPITEISVTRSSESWQPPPLIPPISHDILGRDHYYFRRPVDSNATNKALFLYPYGSDGPPGFDMRVHTGIDMPNDIGQTVRAAATGTILWAGSGFQDSPSYGNAVLIEHEFGFQGRRLYTLYAHLSAVLAVVGEHVETGDAIGLVGNTGHVTGPHVHFEVRMGEKNSTEPPAYGDTYNPVLWMAPYVGTGVIAGRVTDSSGRQVLDANVTIRNWTTGLNTDTTTTYIFQNTSIDVNADPTWHENFVVGDVPAGRYTVIADVNGEPVTRTINVNEGTTTFVELSPGQQPTPETADGSS